MALNFPATPEEGDLYTAEGVTYVWRTNRWVKVSDEELDPVEIVEADMTAKWQVWGDTLVQWGFLVTNSGGNGSITFPKAFKAAPVLMLTPDSGTSFRLTTQTSQLLVNSANVVVSENGTFGAVHCALDRHR